MTSLRVSGIISDELNFVSPPSQTLFCPICQELFDSPVITRECSHSFCANCFEKIDSPVCPLCRTKIHVGNVHQNLALDQLVKEQLVYCRYRQYGCTGLIPLGNRITHDATCNYRPVPCPHSNRGCKVQVPKVEIKKHLESCVFEQLKEYVTRNDEQLDGLKRQIEAQALEIRDLKRKLEDLNGTDSPARMARVASQESNSDSSVGPDSPASSQANGVLVSSAAARAPSPPTPAPPPLSSKDLWNAATLHCELTLAGHTRGVTSLDFSPRTNLLFSGSHDCTIRVWDLTPTMSGNSRVEYKCIKVLTQHRMGVWSLVATEAGDRLFSGSSDTTIVCWDTATFSVLHVMTEHTGKVYSLAIRNNLLFSAGSDRVIRVWELDTYGCIRQMAGHDDTIWSLVAFDNCLYSASDDTTVKVWDLNTFECVFTLEQPPDEEAGKCLTLAIDDKFICMGSNDCKIKIWNRHNYQHLRTIANEHSWEIWQLSTCDGLLFSGSFDHKIKVWDLETFACLQTLEGHKGYVHALTIGKHHVFSGSGDKTIKVWRGIG